jgi:tRNA threonylcarbamoyladenosine biosynthesis protein TsaB
LSADFAGPMLAIESSTPTASIAIGGGDGVLAEYALTLRGGHSAALLPAVQHAMDSVGLTPAELRGVVIGGGPGSFTGLRIAAATGKGIARALDLPLFAYSGLMATAVQLGVSGQPVCAVFDARGQDVFAACYRFGREVEVLLAPVATTVGELPALLGTAAPPLLVGDGATRHRQAFKDLWGSVVAPAHFATPRAAALLWLASAIPQRGRIEEISIWEPEYLRASGAERIAAARSSAVGTP